MPTRRLALAIAAAIMTIGPLLIPHTADARRYDGPCVNARKYNAVIKLYRSAGVDTKREVETFWGLHGHEISPKGNPPGAVQPYPEERDKDNYQWFRYQTCDTADFLYVVYKRPTEFYRHRTWTFMNLVEDSKPMGRWTRAS